MRTMLMAAAILVLASASAAVAQAAEAPAFVVGDNTLYAHATEDSLSVWMNALVQDGFGPYQITGDVTATVPVLGLGMDPVANEAFESRIPLTPGLGEGIVLDGTITVQAYIGGGLVTAGVASIATSLAIDGEVVASAAAKNHAMTPKATAGPYDAIAWTMDVENLEIAAGSTIEWVLSGTIYAGNNVFLASNEARGQSHIILPVVGVLASAEAEQPEGNETTNETIEGNITDDGNETMEPVDDPDTGNETNGPDDCPDSAGCEADNEGGNETVDDTPAAKESPGVALPMVLAMLGAVAVIRLRRS